MSTALSALKRSAHCTNDPDTSPRHAPTTKGAEENGRDEEAAPPAAAERLRTRDRSISPEHRGEQEQEEEEDGRGEH